MRYITFTLALFICCFIAHGQNFPLTDSLKRELASAKSGEQKVFWLGQLAQWYNPIDPNAASVYSKKQLQLAEATTNAKSRLQAFSDHVMFNLTKVPKSVDSATYFANKIMNLGEQGKNNEYKAWGTLMLSLIEMFRGQPDKALQYANRANTSATSVASDSLHWTCSNILAQIVDSKTEKLTAFRHYMNALNLADSVKNDRLLSYSYYNIARFYYSISNYNKAKEYALKALDETFKLNRPYDRIHVYDLLGLAFTDDKLYNLASAYFDKGLKLADTLRAPQFLKVEIYNHVMRQYFLMEDFAQLSRFFNQHEELREVYGISGQTYFHDMLRARIYVYTGKTDSATAYFKKVEPMVDSLGLPFQKHLFYDWYGDYFRRKGDVNNAILYFKKDEAVNAKSNDLENLIKATANLDSMYLLKGDYKTAYSYNNLSHTYVDSLQKLTNEKELLSAEIDQEALRQERMTKQMELDKQRRHNIQYMGITAALAGLIILLIMIGSFSVSVTTIKALGFFTFIFLFEFFIVIADEKIHHLTHGEPWQVVLIKIILACMLVPLHHYTEHKVIHYLSKHKLLNLKKRPSFGVLFKRKRKLVVAETTDPSEKI
jgi:tetratricopeptide (TPR) repeat protein